MSRIKQLPWAWILTILWLIGSQIAAFQIAVLPALFVFLIALFFPPAFIASAIMIIVPILFSLASWVVLFFKKKLWASILSTIGLLISIGSYFLLEAILGGSGIVMP